MVKLADTIDLGSIASACRFKSCYPHQKRLSDLGEPYIFTFRLPEEEDICRNIP